MLEALCAPGMLAVTECREEDSGRHLGEVLLHKVVWEVLVCVALRVAHAHELDVLLLRFGNL